MKRYLSLALAILIFVPALTSCSGRADEKEGTKAGDTTVAILSETKVETDRFSLVFPDDWGKVNVDGGFQLYKESGEVIEVHFRGSNQDEMHAKKQIEERAELNKGTPAKENDLLGKKFWSTRYILNGVDQVINARIDDEGVMISIIYAGPNLDGNATYMDIINSIRFK